ncbi:MAG: hypothetical protein COX02_01460 [Candidatus Vogelbacteria bacterium CG22_combo_CG10-13_8_21_14_all_37_9]|uniref:Membrane fusion protein biotin-lipoyl like domain-containing protein n=1 Tax=Candidatus Vogelbacteria bacterium CG22_combo_CG10-13_8_21_14_all_37_9 TaxID=1975046 RepID=A0A2H0BMJ9_9BACT|nr:MAG: hypothetical protein COX02_01460 [Candidatus Vogelbacteria bacterium CG22_combo_CG10-13_8_21_14_all_37_9]
MNKQFKRLLKNKYLVGGLGVFVVLIIGLIIYFTRSNSSLVVAKVELGTVIQIVDVTGTIFPADKTDLAFQKSGILSRLYVKVGDLVNRGNLLGELESASDRANLAIVQSNFSDLARKLRPEELRLEENKVNATQVILNNEQKNALNVASSAYIKVQGVLFNNTDSFFDNAQSVNPTFNMGSLSYDEENRINQERLKVTFHVFQPWALNLKTTTATSAVELLDQARNYLETTNNFMDHLAVIINNLNSTNTGLSQSVVDSAITKMNTGLSELNQVIDLTAKAQSSLNTAQANYNQANSNFNLALSSHSAEEISSQSAKVDQASAELAKNIIYAPFAGLITRVNPSLGEFVSAGETVFSVISDSNYKIEAYVPESDIAKIKINDLASTTLDAYGSDVYFGAVVTMIDPAETIREGIPTYKVTLQFLNKDQRIRSGLTANLEILSARRDKVLTIPYRAVINTNGVKTARVLNPDGQTYEVVPITTGLRGSTGNIEVLSGLKAGQTVVTYLKS